MAGWNEDAIVEAEDEYTVFIGDNGEATFEGEITAENIRDVAKENGIKQIGVRNTDGVKLAPEDFPVQENIVIFQVNKAG
jgi:AmiR/NasT family two-component response regulator